MAIKTKAYDLDTPKDGSDAVSVKYGTTADKHAMWKMGKVQELSRNFRFVSMYGFTIVVMASWEWVLALAPIVLVDSGTGGFIWLYLISWIGVIIVTLSLAEMGSMAPTSGAVVLVKLTTRKVSEFAPASYQKIASYVVGWLCVLRWRTGAATSAFLVGTHIQALITLNNPSYTFENWHSTLLTIAVCSLSLIFNVICAKNLPLVESLVVVVHIFSFIAVTTILWLIGPVADAHVTSTTFNDGGGWGSVSVATLAGIELRDAPKTLPHAMLWTILTYRAMGRVIVITFCSVLSRLDDALASPTKQPYIYVFYNATKSVRGATAMGVVVISILVFCSVTTTATSSRQLFAFAHDQGIPFGKTFSAVSPTWEVPLNALWFSFVFSVLLSLLNLGSPVALNSIGSLGSASALISYTLSISFIAMKRIRGEPMLPSKFPLGRLGMPTNITSIYSHVGSVTIFAASFYYLRGKRVYAGPVAYVRKSV
ncbi:amino acid/polyamine transporter I [Clohesyomyces aquaticus]|uniref:Amino acid/polyamine transporter I n=1 Tax=Clohesyomyces aquaticus TaxID=1231657 RepID=A0A1Y1Z2Z6_9PLEO|nr:amino acid/polyamine transporter I [Clohesyomyces aquaticus]